jgi:hypothetical protein
LCWSKSECPATGDAVEHGARIELDPLHLQVPRDWPSPSLDELLIAPEPQPLAVTHVRRCAPWRAPPAVTFLRSNESDRFRLLDCDGAVTTDALDRLSVLARPIGAERPDLPLPFDPIAGDGEWVPDVRLLSPRLVWALSRVAEAFPGHAIEIVSGYRPSAHGGGSHARAEALDFALRGVPKEAVFAVCRRLRDVGCGYYPENRFIHLDVRPYGTGHVAWVDASRPGEPSRYVDGWPGVLSPTRQGARRPEP